MTGEGEQPTESVAIVRAVFAAQQAGRIEDMLALVHPDVVWQPLTRPGRTNYLGYAGTRQMLEDLARVLGDFRLHFDSVVELPDGRVSAVGRAVTVTGDAETVVARFECVITLRDDQIIQLESAEPPDA